MPLSVLFEEFLKYNIPLSREIKTKINNYIKLILEFNSHTNILGTSDTLDIYYKHILDCALAYPHFEKNKTIADIGTGAGLPGIILAIFGFAPIYLVESKQKKIVFLNKALMKLKLKEVKILPQNAKEVNIPMDIITCRAFSNIKKCIQLTKKMRTTRTKYIFYKGKKCNIDKELQDNVLNPCQILKIKTPTLLGERNLVIGNA